MKYKHSMRNSCTLDGFTTDIVISSLEEILSEKDDRVFVTDQNVEMILPEHEGINLLVLPAGEEFKRWESVEKIIEFALASGLGRDSKIIGIGGGVICDMAAFAASIYMRGISVELVPTTLLSMVDASLGGKTGADFTKVKNIIGTFHPADRVHICTDTLFSLTEEEYKNGLAEVIKHGLLLGGKLLHMITDNREPISKRSDKDLLERMIFESVLVKKQFIEKDPKERLGERAKLNLGHTFGHALETISDLSVWSHGAAVAWGIARAMEVGVEIGETELEYADYVKSLLKDYGFEIEYKIPRDEIDLFLKIISHDKKKRAGKVHFVLQSGVGTTFLTPLSEEIIRKVVSA